MVSPGAIATSPLRCAPLPVPAQSQSPHPAQDPRAAAQLDDIMSAAEALRTDMRMSGPSMDLLRRSRRQAGAAPLTLQQQMMWEADEDAMEEGRAAHRWGHQAPKIP